MVDTAELSPEAERLLPALDALSERDRLLLSRRLLSVPKLSEQEQQTANAEWKAELRRRVEEIKSGKVVGIPAEEVDRKMRAKYP